MGLGLSAAFPRLLLTAPLAPVNESLADTIATKK
jgi:hypothetical protein